MREWKNTSDKWGEGRGHTLELRPPLHCRPRLEERHPCPRGEPGSKRRCKIKACGMDTKYISFPFLLALDYRTWRESSASQRWIRRAIIGSMYMANSSPMDWATALYSKNNSKWLRAKKRCKKIRTENWEMFNGNLLQAKKMAYPNNEYTATRASASST